MRKNLVVTVMSVMMLFLTSEFCFAGNGAGPGDRSGPTHSITCGGETATGMVVSLLPGSGMELQDGTTIFGIGPKRYWDILEVDRPEPGDEVAVTFCTVDTMDGSSFDVAQVITIDQVTVELRGEDGLPLWGRRGVDMTF